MFEVPEKPMEQCPDCNSIALKQSKKREWCIICGYVTEK